MRRREVVTKLHYLQRLEALSILKPLVKAGIISTTVIAHRDIAQTYEALRKAGMGKMDAYHEVSETTGHTVQHVWRVVKSMTDVVVP